MNLGEWGMGAIHHGMKMKQKQRKEVRGGVWDKETIDKGASGPRSSALLLAFNVRIFQSLFGSGFGVGGGLGSAIHCDIRMTSAKYPSGLLGGLSFLRNKQCLVAVTGLPAPGAIGTTCSLSPGHPHQVPSLAPKGSHSVFTSHMSLLCHLCPR